jgi:hypothetical protein
VQAYAPTITWHKAVNVEPNRVLLLLQSIYDALSDITGIQERRVWILYAVFARMADENSTPHGGILLISPSHVGLCNVG